jgi:ADP-ribosylglycohydrolase
MLLGGSKAADASARARISLDGLSVGDAFGERFFGEVASVLARIASRSVPGSEWPYTDDTEMALSIVELLHERGAIDQDDLAQRFARRMQFHRGYGRGAYLVLEGIRIGRPWAEVSRAGFDGMGSFGNGAAMRVAPLGAFFADRELDFIAEQAALSAEVTHAHPEGIAGGIAVAVAAAIAARNAGESAPLGRSLIEQVLALTPKGYTHDGIAEALSVPPHTPPVLAARALGNGSRVIAQDTVPFCLWVCACHSHDFVEALWNTVTALGDRDTTCAIVGGIVACQAGRNAIPAEWLEKREALPIDLE